MADGGASHGRWWRQSWQDRTAALCPNRVISVGEALGRTRANPVPGWHRGSGAGGVVGDCP